MNENKEHEYSEEDAQEAVASTRGSVGNIFQDIYYTIVYNFSLFLGVALVSFAVLNFDHGRYCDGTEADHFSCLNSATYYEYSLPVIGVFVIGALCVAYWIARGR